MAVWSVATHRSLLAHGRTDAEFFRPEFLEAEAVLSCVDTNAVARHFEISDGNHLEVSRWFTDEGGAIPYYRGQDLNGFFLENSTPVQIPRNIYDRANMHRSHFLPEDVLICIVGASTGTISVVTSNTIPCTGSCKIGIVRRQLGGLVDPFFLAAFLLGKFGQYQIARHSRGTAQGGLILKDIFKLLVPVLPDVEQRLIRNLVGNALSLNTQAVKYYSDAEQLLELELGLDKLTFQKPMGYTARFSDLETSFRSDAQHYQPRFQQLTDHLSTFPIERVRNIRTYNRRGLQPIYVQNGKVDVINSQHLGPKHIDYEGLQKTSATAFAAAPEAHIQQHDLLIYTTGAYIGRTNVYLSDAPAMASNHVNILRLRPGIDAAYMAMVFQSVVGQFQTQKYARGSAQAELYPADIDRFVVPLIDCQQQKAIGDLVRESLGKQQESRRLLEQGKARVEQLIEEAARA